jgi:DNA-binding transcriptional ArsR family regulator
MMVKAKTKPTLRHNQPDELFRAIADPCRRQILSLLRKDELPLGRISRRFDMSRPGVIKHLRVLKSCGLVQVRKQGRQTLHRLNAVRLREIRNWVGQFESFWEDGLQRLKQQVESNL